MVWHRFLRDYEAVINSHKTAETILAELEMETNIKQLERDGRLGLTIEDALLKHAYTESRMDTMNVPKPWEPGWAGYVKHQQAAGIVDLKSQLDSLTRTIKGHKNKNKVKAPKPFGAENTLPDRPTPQAKPRLLHPIPSKEEVAASKLAASRAPSASQLTTSSKSSSALVPANESVVAVAEEQEVEEEEEVEQEEVDVYAVHRYKAPKFKQIHSQTALDKRRLSLAHAVVLDAKFLKFTKRLTTSSCLLIPLRDPQAPLNDTEEEHSLIRRIVSQGPDHDKFEKYKKNDRFAELVGIKYDLPLSSIGAYSKPVDYSIPNDRDLLYDSLSSKELPSGPAKVSALGGAASRPGTSPTKEQKVVVDVERRAKIDLVNDVRPRYVKADLLPSSRVVSVVERMSNEKKERDAAALRKKQGLSNDAAVAEARARMEAEIAQNTQNVLNGVDSGAPTAEAEYMSRGKKRASEERNLTMSNMFLQKEEVKYGAGRITSTHNCIGKIEEPWITVGARYKTVAGDRTA